MKILIFVKNITILFTITLQDFSRTFKMSTSYAEEIENDLNIHLYSNIDMKNEQSPAEIFKLFDKLLFKFGRFPAVDTLAIVPTGVVP